MKRFEDKEPVKMSPTNEALPAAVKEVAEAAKMYCRSETDDLTPLERLHAYQRLMDACKVLNESETQEASPPTEVDESVQERLDRLELAKIDTLAETLDALGVTLEQIQGLVDDRKQEERDSIMHGGRDAALKYLLERDDEEHLLAYFREVGGDAPDLYVKKAMELFEVPAEEVTPEMRQKAKVRNFAKLYGSDEKALQESLQKALRPDRKKDKDQ